MMLSGDDPRSAHYCCRLVHLTIAMALPKRGEISKRAARTNSNARDAQEVWDMRATEQVLVMQANMAHSKMKTPMGGGA